MKLKIPFLILIVLSTTFFISFYGKVVFHPDNYLFSNEGDGIKNYFTYASHIKNDSSYVNFEGMNYPYGEHFFYTDCHPVIAVFFKMLASKFQYFSLHSIGIINFLMILSIFLSFYVCYFLLKEFGVNSWLSLLYSLGITLLAPQIFRMGGHLALSYSVAIPLSWLIILKILHHPNKPIYPIIFFVNNLFWLFIHAYLGVIILFFLSAFIIAKYIADRSRWTATAHYFKIFSAIVAPIILFSLFVFFTDTHIGRTDNPSGFFLYNAEFDDVFLPHHPPLRRLIDALTGNIINQKWEAWSYVGFSTTIIFIFLLVLSFKKMLKRRQETFLNTFFKSEIMNVSLIAAFVVLLFAMAFPFIQFPGLLEVFPILKQFRATGRFAWPFYFVALVFAATVMQEIYTKSLNQPWKKFAVVLCIMVGVFNVVEGFYYHIETSTAIVKSKNLFKKEFLPDSFKTAFESVNPENFQAIIALPFYYQGSESFSITGSSETFRASLLLSYFTGLPNVCANLTRTSIKESKNIIEMVAPDFYKKDIIADLPDNRPFLAVRSRDSISKYENDIFVKCKPLFANDEISLYSLAKDDLFRNSGQSIYEKFIQIKPTLFQKNSFYLSDENSFFYYNSFEETKSDWPFRGNGGFRSIKKGKNTFAEFAPETFMPGKKYSVSLWMYNGQKDALNDWFRFIIEEFDEEKNNWVSTTCFPAESEVINGDWSLVESTFEIKNPKSRIFIVTKGKDNSRADLFADDLLITETGVDVYGFDENSKRLFYNNHDVVLK